VQITHQPLVIAETGQKGAVARRQHILEEFLQVVLMLPDEVFLAAAGIDDEAKRERNIRAAGEKRYLLRDAVFEDLKIVLRQPGGQRAVRIPHRKRHVNQVYVHADGGRLLGRGDGGERNERSE
jgi:hypothetical protein